MRRIVHIWGFFQALDLESENLQQLTQFPHKMERVIIICALLTSQDKLMRLDLGKVCVCV